MVAAGTIRGDGTADVECVASDLAPAAHPTAAKGPGDHHAGMPPVLLCPSARIGRRAVRVALLLGGALAAGVLPAQNVQPDLGAAGRLVIDKTNEFRAGQRLTPTKPDPQLEDAARDLAAFMARTDRYGHDADGKSPADRAQARGYTYCALAENIAFLSNPAGTSTAALVTTVVEGWKQSPTHRRNMLLPEVVDTAVALAQSPTSQRYYVVQLFGRPRSAIVHFSVVNATANPLRYRLAGQSFHLPPGATRNHEQCRAGALDIGTGPRSGSPIEPADGKRYTLEAVDSTGVRVREE